MMFKKCTVLGRFLVAAALFAAAFAPGCDDADFAPDSAAPASHSAIVGGVEESGYPAVGALVYSTGSGGSYFCSATLIAPKWVLTAAHCVSFGGGKEPGLYFYIGTDANNSDSSDLHGFADVTVHPDYDPDLIINDIALIELETEVDSADATPIPVNMESIEDIEGEDVFYVGFGITTSLGGDEGGIKRSVTIPLWEVGEIAYSSKYEPDETGFCSGDSGGPGMYDFGEGLRVIGVNSTGSQTDPSDSCIGYYNDTRVDAFADWIAETMGTTAPSCTDDPDLCWCDGVCSAEGVCDNGACGTEECGTAFMCYMSSGSFADSSDCLVAALPSELTGLSDLYNCLVENCASSTTYPALADCLQTSCSSEVVACLDVSMCDLVGGDCGATTACRPEPTYDMFGYSNCIASDDLAYGSMCDGAAEDPTSCADGLLCLNTGGGAKCHQLCRTNTDCTLGGGECQVPVFASPNNDVGYCADDFSTTDTDTDTDTGTDTGTDTDADTDTDTDTDADGGVTTEIPEDDCGCSAVGSPLSSRGLLAAILG